VYLPDPRAPPHPVLAAGGHLRQGQQLLDLRVEHHDPKAVPRLQLREEEGMGADPHTPTTDLIYGNYVFTGIILIHMKAYINCFFILLNLLLTIYLE